MHINDLTVVLTLKDRSAFTYRWMQWMEEQRFPYKILIADGGSDRAIERHLPDRTHYPHLDYEYIRYPFDSDLHAYMRKLADVADRVKTEFVLSADNDDLILLEPLQDNLARLRELKSVHTLGPVHYWFKVRKNAKSLSDLACAGSAAVEYTRDKPMVDALLEDGDPLTRLFRVVESVYSPLIYYGIHRAADYRRINHGALNLGFRRRVFREWHTLYVYALSGKMILGRADRPFMLRQHDTSQSATEINPVENLANIYLLPDWSEQLYSMMGDLFHMCEEMNYGIPRHEFEERFRGAFRKQMLSWLQFRDLADRFRRFPRLYACGRWLFAVYRGETASAISARDIHANPILHRAANFIEEYKAPHTCP
jgi:glycosyltransferase domain-containing protein